MNERKTMIYRRRRRKRRHILNSLRILLVITMEVLIFIFVVRTVAVCVPSLSLKQLIAPWDKTSNTLNGADDNWKLTLVNQWHELPNNYSTTLTQIRNGQAIDERCFSDLQAMMDDCQEAGLSPLICSSYRTQEKQESLYDSKVKRLVTQGYSHADAKNEAGKEVAVPGTSEHQLGLAVDIVDVEYQILDEAQEKTDVQRWLMEHSWEYGFILRYPNDKKDITGVIYEPWHYRYVGKEAAKEIYEQSICLEEYLDTKN